ncbi:DinB family protein [Limnoglobus roseus]|uniref:DinB-like domain-containing protein n=1 Tax=Limnoglobus roseus TaxID=2598579 RepID=A0A5C1AEM5_9BACT|nr:DinB family protein [Limnoglobus roseus]QEL16687.1 hypothetical protein PX52LOC_03650 [Limnoglobus roseus]
MELIDAYLAGAGAVQQAITGLAPEQLKAYPVAGTWSIQEIVCHLADSEALFAERMKRVLSEDRPPLLFADPSRHAETLAYQSRDAADDAELIGMIRQQMARILRTQPPEAWARTGVHNKVGEQTLEQLVRKAVDHLEHHLKFVRAKRHALGVPPTIDATP